MRSKEVEEAIKNLMSIVVTDIYGNEIRIDNKSVGTVLDYIKKLEKLPNKIRDKIEELAEWEHDDDFEINLTVRDKLEVLREILGE